jgi:hypothetical protein
MKHEATWLSMARAALHGMCANPKGDTWCTPKTTAKAAASMADQMVMELETRNAAYDKVTTGEF